VGVSGHDSHLHLLTKHVLPYYVNLCYIISGSAHVNITLTILICSAMNEAVGSRPASWVHGTLPTYCADLF